MRDPSTSPARRRLHRIGVVVAVAAGLLAIYSCSLIVETSSQQCQQDSDCSMLMAGATCDTATNACVLPSGPSSSTGTAAGSSSSGGAATCNVDGGIDGGGCYNTSLAACPVNPQNANSELQNACTTGCIPFDDSLVMGLLPNGSLPLLPNPPDGGL
jgi:hypothetical protein